MTLNNGGYESMKDYEESLEERKIVIGYNQTNCPLCGGVLVRNPNGTFVSDVECKGCGLSA